MTEFYLISGFLGSGKTTLLQNILDEYADKRRIAVIQNEFAPSGIDGKELKKTGHDFHLMEINNGSVFCVCMLGTFLQNLESLIARYDPEMVFLEASGLSDPVNIIEMLQAENLHGKLSLSGIITVIDVPNFERGFQSLPRFRHQIMIADIILLNKTDLFEDDPAGIKKKIATLNPFARLLETRYCSISLENIFEAVQRDHPAASRFLDTESAGRPEMHVCVLRMGKKISPQKLPLFLDEIQGDSLRLKGYINLSDDSVVAVQTVFDQRKIKKIRHYTGPTELIAFSSKLDMKRLRQIFINYTE